MPKFDLKTFGAAAGGGGNTLNALGTTFGVPSCVMNLGAGLLGALGSDILGGIRSDVSIGKNAASAVVKALSSKLRNLTGIIEFDTEDGLFRFVSDSSQYGQERGGALGAIGNLLGAIDQAVAFGGQLYSNYETATSQLNEIKDCIGGYEEYLKHVGGEQGNARADLDSASFATLLESELGNSIREANDANRFIAEASETIRIIDSIIVARINDPSLEPQFTDTEPSGIPTETSGIPEEELLSVFRLNAGPPLSKTGQFLLSVDGLYYDSQSDGLAPALLELKDRSLSRDSSLDWKLEYDPSLGGRGLPTTQNDLDIYFNTILDPDIVDDSKFLQNYYDQDDTIVNLIGQRDRKVYDVSAELAEQQAAGASQVIIDNLKQVMISESSRFITDVKKRKKQIELAVKMPAIYGKGEMYGPGYVPVNDFSYLAGVNFIVDIQRQRSLTIAQDDVKGVVLPIETKFTEKIESGDAATLNHLLLASIPNGITIDSANASGSVSASLASVPTLVDNGLFGLYNYLTLKDSSPSSPVFGLRNSTDKGVAYNAQLVGNLTNVLDRGIGIAYLNGVAGPDLVDPSFIASAGSYVKLPEKQEFQDFLYNKGGASFETWVYTPNLSSADGFNINSEVSGLYQLILANENTGQGPTTSAQEDILNLRLDEGVEVTRGLIFGFTRDCRFTRKVMPSNLEADNSISDVSLVLAPTQSYDSSSVGFLSNVVDIGSCESASSWKGMVIPVASTFSEATLSSCASSFCQLSLTLNPLEDEISVYLDGTLLATSGYGSVFGVNALKTTPKIPSIPPDNAFEYNTTNITGSSLEAYKYGPGLDTYFTPWIVGGGYTDGNPNGNFMGGEYGGKVSGLKGYMGCTRFYSKPLTSAEVLNNYNATKNFFKNIKL